jgi:hypothetical protein
MLVYGGIRRDPAQGELHEAASSIAERADLCAALAAQIGDCATSQHQ